MSIEIILILGLYFLFAYAMGVNSGEQRSEGMWRDMYWNLRDSMNEEQPDESDGE